MPIYRLQFLVSAKTEWDKLDGSVQLQFTKVLTKRLETPRVPKAALAGLPDCYKIKLRTVGYRLVYQVRDETLVLLTMAVGKRERNAVYDAAMARLPIVKTEEKAKSPCNIKPSIAKNINVAQLGLRCELTVQLYGATGAMARILPVSLSRTTVMSSLRASRTIKRQEADFGFVDGFGGEECF